MFVSLCVSVFSSFYLALPSLALHCLPCLALPCLALPCLALLCLALPCLFPCLACKACQPASQTASVAYQGKASQPNKQDPTQRTPFSVRTASETSSENSQRRRKPSSLLATCRDCHANLKRTKTHLSRLLAIYLKLLPHV